MGDPLDEPVPVALEQGRGRPQDPSPGGRESVMEAIVHVPAGVPSEALGLLAVVLGEGQGHPFGGIKMPDGRGGFAEPWATPALIVAYGRKDKRIYTALNTKYEIMAKNLKGETEFVIEKKPLTRRLISVVAWAGPKVARFGPLRKILVNNWVKKVEDFYKDVRRYFHVPVSGGVYR